MCQPGLPGPHGESQAGSPALEDLELLNKLPSYEDKGTDPLFEKGKETEEAFFLALGEDFNTPQALAVIYILVRELTKINNMSFSEGKISHQELQAYEFAVDSLIRNLRGVFWPIRRLQTSV